MTPLTAPVVCSGWPVASTRVNDPVTAGPPLWIGAVAVTGVSVTVPTNAPAGMPVPVTDRPSSVATIALSVIVAAPAAAVAPASVRGTRHGVAAAEQAGAGGLRRNGLVHAVRRAVDEGVVTRSRVQLVAAGVLASGVLGPVGSKCTLLPYRFSPAVSERHRGRRVGGDDRRVGEAVAGVGERREGLVEGDVDKPAVLERRRGLDLGDDVLEEQVRSVQPAGVVHWRVRCGRVGPAAGQVVAVAHRVVGIAAVVRRDPAERRRRRLVLQVVVQPVGRDRTGWRCARVAVPGLQDRLEPGEREVLGDILVGGVRAARIRLACGPVAPGEA